MTVLNRLSVDVWGVLGGLCLIVAFLVQFVRHKGRTNAPSIPASHPRNVLIAWGATAGLYLIGFLYLPAKPAYLLPFVPFAFFLCARLLERKYFIVLCLTLLLSPFVLGFDLSRVAGGRIYLNASLNVNLFGRELTLDFLLGQLTLDHLHRVDKIQVANQVLSFGGSVTRKAAIVQGEWQPQIQAHTPAPANPLTVYVYFLSLDQLKNYLAQGYDVYYLPGQRELNLDVYNFDLQKNGAWPYAGSDLD